MKPKKYTNKQKLDLVVALCKEDIDFWKGKYFLSCQANLLYWSIILIISAISFIKLIWSW